MIYVIAKVIDGKPHFFEGEYEEGYKWTDLGEEFACVINTMKQARELQNEIGGIIVPLMEHGSESRYIISMEFSKNDTRYFVGLDNDGEQDWTLFKDSATTFFDIKDAQQWQAEVGGILEII